MSIFLNLENRPLRRVAPNNSCGRENASWEGSWTTLARSSIFFFHLPKGTFTKTGAGDVFGC